MLFGACGGAEPAQAWVATPFTSAGEDEDEDADDDADDDAPRDDDMPSDDDASDDDDDDTALDTGDPSLESSTSSGAPQPPLTPSEMLCQHLQTRPPPDVDAATVVDAWEAFAEAYIDRHHGAANNTAAATFLRDELASFGYDTRILELSSGVGTVRIVEGLKRGTVNPERAVAIGAHYDVVNATTDGAYDNASGVAVELSLCELLAAQPTAKSVACLFFDAEEVGREGSRAYVAQTELQFDQMFGYDMVGLNAPGMHWKLYASLGLDGPGLDGLTSSHAKFVNTALQGCLASELGSDDDGFELLEYYDKRSDESRFMEAGVPIIRFAGGREASDYGGYHNASDTIEFVYDVAGGRAAFEAGIERAIEVSYYTILAFDPYDPKSLPRL